MCPRPQRPSFFVLPGAKQKHTHPLLQKGFFRRALRRALSSMPFVNMYPMLAFTLAATRKFTPCMCCVLFADLYREWKRERSCTLVHIRLWRGNERTMMQNTLQALGIVGQDDENCCRRRRIVCFLWKSICKHVTWERERCALREESSLHPTTICAPSHRSTIYKKIIRLLHFSKTEQTWENFQQQEFFSNF